MIKKILIAIAIVAGIVILVFGMIRLLDRVFLFSGDLGDIKVGQVYAFITEEDNPFKKPDTLLMKIIGIKGGYCLYRYGDISDTSRFIDSKETKYFRYKHYKLVEEE